MSMISKEILLVQFLLLFALISSAVSITTDREVCEDCDPVGSLSQLCDAEVCVDCKPGVGGVKCDQCLPQFYNFSNVGCSECGCHPNTSMNQQCDDSGVCPCVATATGDKCNVCADGYHVIEFGCVSCPTCYNEVAILFNQTGESHNDLLNQINFTLSVLEGVGNDTGSGDEGGFLTPEVLEQLKSYQVTLEELLERAVNITGRENEVKQLLNSLIKETDSFEVDVKALEENVTSTENVTSELSNLVRELRENLTQAKELLMSAQIKLRDEVWVQLEMAMTLNSKLRRRFNELRGLATEVNSTSHEQEALANSLLEDVTCALDNTSRALELLTETIALQNSTLDKVRRIEEDILPPIFEAYMEARSVFSDAVQNVPRALDEANRVLEAVQNVSVSEFDAESRHRELDQIESETLELSISASSVQDELEPLLANFTSLNSSAVELLTESRELNSLSQELLAVAHSARALAEDSVGKGNALIAEGRSLLSQLQEQLKDADNFTAELEEVIRNIERVENGSITVEEKAGGSAIELMEVTSVVNLAAQTLQNASLAVQEALELAIQFNKNATVALEDATRLNADAQELATNVSTLSNKVDDLEQTVTDDKRTITMTIDTAKETIALADNTTQEIIMIRELLVNLSLELNSTELLSPDRIISVNETLIFLEQEASTNQVEVDAIAEQVGQLEESAEELRERYTELQQHRDLLRQILGNIEGLDCRNQFAGFT